MCLSYWTIAWNFWKVLHLHSDDRKEVVEFEVPLVFCCLIVGYDICAHCCLSTPVETGCCALWVDCIDTHDILLHLKLDSYASIISRLSASLTEGLSFARDLTFVRPFSVLFHLFNYKVLLGN